MRRGINHKRINITLDSDTLAILEKYRAWGTPASALIRKALRSYEMGRNKSVSQYIPPEETTVTYD